MKRATAFNIYDTLGRISEETHLDKNEKMCYTYDELNRVTKRTIKDLSGTVLSEESFSYDAAGNITGGSANTTFVYDTNNRLVTYNGNAVSYDLDGNMLDNGSLSCTYDSANRLLTAGGNIYTYNAEDVRIKNVHYGVEEKYTYDTVSELSRLLTRTVGANVTKYVYGLGLISEETNSTVKVYHFDYRGSTVAITDVNGNISDTFTYDTYGKIISRIGNSDIIFCYNGRDGVVTDSNNLIYMRARYYSPDMRRFVNADILHGKISDSTSLNRYSYVNGNPISNIDPFGLSAERFVSGAYLKKTSFKTINSKDLINILDLIKITYTQTITYTKVYGTQGGLLGFYPYSEISEDNLSYGLNLDLLKFLELDVSLKLTGLEVSGGININSIEYFISGEINFVGNSKISVGFSQQLDDGTEIDNQYSIEANTGLIVSAVLLVIGLPIVQPEQVFQPA